MNTRDGLNENKREKKKKSMSTMIIIEETNSQMFPSALSKRMKENRKRIPFAFYTKIKIFRNYFMTKNDQSD